MSYYNYSLSNDLIGKTKTLKQLINQAISEIPHYIDFDIIVKAYKKFKQFANKYYPDVQIISINPIGLRGIFKDEIR